VLTLCAIVPTLKTTSQTVSGLVNITAADAFPLVRREGAASQAVQLRRIRGAGRSDWEWITDPPDGITVGGADILIARAEAERFEQQHGLFPDSAISNALEHHRSRRQGVAGPGAPARYEWDAFYGAIARRIHEHGIPPTQAELIREMLDWFGQRDDTPDESTVRRKVAVIWRELTRA
jgi:hypothetical protein